eukprot:TRINITY_DN95696_c0_g1_i1.p1 TRINITY_DN95696_c0_g1~~TRINITY_DN95696_c0_g1_i1.p1  ORF type:complete len:297 (-),score=38.66 TRINITY_DN95696_c0_g1_i1:164-1030(-)
MYGVLRLLVLRLRSFFRSICKDSHEVSNTSIACTLQPIGAERDADEGKQEETSPSSKGTLTVSTLLDEVWLSVLSCCTPLELCKFARIDKRFRQLANDDNIWRQLCRARWVGKQGMSDALFRNGNYSLVRLSITEIKDLLRRRNVTFDHVRERHELLQALSSSNPTVSTLSAAEPLPIPGKWKVSYAYAELDSCRQTITEDEVGHYRWQLIYHGTPSNLGLRHFQRNGVFVSPHFGETRWSLHSNGQYFVMQGVAPLQVKRNLQNWGWTIGEGSGTEYHSRELGGQGA